MIKSGEKKPMSRRQKIALSYHRTAAYLAGKTGDGNSKGMKPKRGHGLAHDSGNSGIHGNGRRPY
jgi:hypothetical protein